MMSNVWEIRVADHTTWVASHNGREVFLGYPIKLGKHQVGITWNRSTQIHTFDLEIAGDVNRIVIQSHGAGKVSSEPGTSAVELQGRGFKIEIEEVGTAIYRPIPKQIETSIADEHWEEALVWLTGTLMVIGFPAMLD